MKILKIFGYCITTIICLVCVASMILFYSGYSLSKEQILKEADVAISDEEFDFAGFMMPIISGTDDGMFNLSRVVKKTAFLYKDVIDEMEEINVFDDKDEQVAILYKIKGSKKDYYFIRYCYVVDLSQFSDNADSDAGDPVYYSEYKLLSDTITVNGKEIKLKYWSYFTLNEEIDTLEIDGKNLTLGEDEE